MVRRGSGFRVRKLDDARQKFIAPPRTKNLARWTLHLVLVRELKNCGTGADSYDVMVFAKSNQRQSCELHEASLWYELIITAPNGVKRVERYTERAAMLRRQHELLTAWKAQGWRELEPEPAAVRTR